MDREVRVQDGWPRGPLLWTSQLWEKEEEGRCVGPGLGSCGDFQARLTGVWQELKLHDDPPFHVGSLPALEVIHGTKPEYTQGKVLCTVRFLHALRVHAASALLWCHRDCAHVTFVFLRNEAKLDRKPDGCVRGNLGRETTPSLFVAVTVRDTWLWRCESHVGFYFRRWRPMVDLVAVVSQCVT